jgi:MoxR-like ATPase
MLAHVEPSLGPGELSDLQSRVKTVHVAAPLLDYIQALVDHTRRSPEYSTGLSPRAALALLHSSRAWALLEGRDKVIPEDVQAVLPGVAGHRLRPVHDGVRVTSVEKANDLISAVPIP